MLYSLLHLFSPSLCLSSWTHLLSSFCHPSSPTKPILAHGQLGAPMPQHPCSTLMYSHCYILWDSSAVVNHLIAWMAVFYFYRWKSPVWAALAPTLSIYVNLGKLYVQLTCFPQKMYWISNLLYFRVWLYLEIESLQIWLF